MSAATTRPWSFGEDAARYAALGVGMEVWEQELDPARLDEQFGRLRELGVAVSSVQPRTIALFPSLDAPEPPDPRSRAALDRDSIRRLARYVPGVPFVANTGALPDGDEARVWDGCVRHHRELAEEAEAHGVRIAPEPLTASLMNRTTVVYQLAEALEMAGEVGHPAFGVCADVYRLWPDAAMEADIAAARDRLFLAQVSDRRRPRSFQDRRVIGDGTIPLVRFLLALDAAGYAGPHVLELFSAGVRGVAEPV